jgi:hypothetical protein
MELFNGEGFVDYAGDSTQGVNVKIGKCENVKIVKPGRFKTFLMTR